MSETRSSLLRFGVFEANVATGELRKNGRTVNLQPQPFKLLVMLLQRQGELVTRSEIQQKLWGEDTFVEFGQGLNFAINKIRQALGDDANRPRYIETLPRRGYRFIGQVQRAVGEPIPAEASWPRATTPLNQVVPISEGLKEALEFRQAEGARSGAEVDLASQVRGSGAPALSSAPLPEGQSPAPGRSFPGVVAVGAPSAVRVPAVTAASRRIRWAILLVGLGLALVAALVFRPVVPPPEVTRIRQITHIGSVLANTRLLTDGPRIYFRAWNPAKEGKSLLYVSAEGGEVFPVDSSIPGRDIDIDDISPNGSEFLAVDLNSGDPYTLWRVPTPSGPPQPVGKVRADEPQWSPDGSTIAYAIDSDLYLVNSDGSNSRKIASLPGDADYLHWSPNGKHLRFSVRNPKGFGATLWQADFPANTVRPLLPDWGAARQALAGGWTPDGRYFFYSALGDGTRGIWAIREQQGWRRVNGQPVRLTTGPISFYEPTPSKDGKSIFAVGEQLRGQLLRYDRGSRQFVPYAGGLSADHVAFSRDGQWMAYVEFPEGILVCSRVDGSDRRQLTFPPMRVYNPQWSPDGLQLAIQASAEAGAPNKIYLVSRDGGMPVLAAPERRDRQVYPSWSPEGNSILFSSFDENGSNPALWILDLKVGRASSLPGTAGLWNGQLSPDGRHVVALQGRVQDGHQKLMLYDKLSHNARTVAEDADYPHWSTDGKYVYFRTPYFSRFLIKNRGVYRWRASTNTVETVVPDPPEFRLKGVFGVWSGVTPDGAPLVVKDLSNYDVYRLDLDLP